MKVAFQERFRSPSFPNAARLQGAVVVGMKQTELGDNKTELGREVNHEVADVEAA